MVESVLHSYCLCFSWGYMKLQYISMIRGGKRMDKLECLKRELFFLEMKDRWDYVDHQEAERLRKEIADLEGKIQE